jgi:hypothetical protein
MSLKDVVDAIAPTVSLTAPGQDATVLGTHKNVSGGCMVHSVTSI